MLQNRFFSLLWRRNPVGAAIYFTVARSLLRFASQYYLDIAL